MSTIEARTALQLGSIGLSLRITSFSEGRLRSSAAVTAVI